MQLAYVSVGLPCYKPCASAEEFLQLVDQTFRQAATSCELGLHLARTDESRHPFDVLRQAEAKSLILERRAKLTPPQRLMQLCISSNNDLVLTVLNCSKPSVRDELVLPAQTPLLQSLETIRNIRQVASNDLRKGRQRAQEAGREQGRPGLSFLSRENPLLVYLFETSAQYKELVILTLVEGGLR